MSALEPLLRVVDLDIGESAAVELSDGSSAAVKLLGLKEEIDPISRAVRRAEVTVEVNGQTAKLVSA
ncbi:MAG: hypothetical protein KJT03_18195, partial [Verrucomicrobiae bacterium]|nr:hypothetical protein [Verrucomicrobiae bacterium]